jgi:hypothetical protein
MHRRITHTLALIALATPVGAQAGAQRVVLELRPRFGDTLNMRVDQTTEVTGTRKGMTAKPVLTQMSMYSRAIVELTTPAAAMILAITDSVNATATDDRARQLVSATERELEGRQMRLRMAPDGTVGLADQPPQTPQVPQEVNDLIALMPASLPRGSVAVGDTWLREMRLPPSANFGVPVAGVVKAAFRLDSVTADGDHAFLSMRGTLEPSKDAVVPAGTYTGTVTGRMIVDRRRGWFSETAFQVLMRTAMLPVPASPDTIHLRLKLTQHMVVTDKR